MNRPYAKANKNNDKGSVASPRHIDTAEFGEILKIRRSRQANKAGNRN